MKMYYHYRFMFISSQETFQLKNYNLIVHSLEVIALGGKLTDCHS